MIVTRSCTSVANITTCACIYFRSIGISILLNYVLVESWKRYDTCSYVSLVGEGVISISACFAPRASLNMTLIFPSLQIDWAGSVIRQLRSDEHISQLVSLDLPSLDHTPIIISDKELQDPLIVLLMFYTSKALEFPQPVLTRSASQQLCEWPIPTV